MATEKHFIKTGSRPKVFLFTIGNLNARRARAAFATNFFGCAGYEIIDNVGFKTVDEGVEMSINSEAEIVVICSSDDEYKELVPEISAKIRDNIKNTALIVAGYPAEIVEDLKQVGIDDFIFLKSNTFEILTKYQERLGVMNS